MARKMHYTSAAIALLSNSALAQQGMFAMYTPGGDDTSVQRIDPIIAPGGISGHVHHVFGANALKPTLSYDELQTSTCTTVGAADFQGNGADHSIYWHPALYMEATDGSGYVRVPTNGHKMYYLDVGEGEKVEPFEFSHNFRMISGDPFARAPTGTNAVLWKCSTGGSYNEGSNGAFPTGVTSCSDYPYFYGSVEFPHCWNGDDYNPADPSAHMAYPEGDIRGGSCPSSHPKRLPHLFIENFFDIDQVDGKPGSFVLAQGDNTGYGMHADFFNGWEDGALPQLLSTCPQPQYGNEDVGTCPSFKSSGPASSCSLPVQYKENVDKPGKYLPGCNPVLDKNPSPIFAIAAQGVSTDQCKAVDGGSSPSPSNSAPQPTNSSTAASTPQSQSGSAPAPSASPSSASYQPFSGSTTGFMTTLASMTSTYAYSPPASPTNGETKTKHRHSYHPRPTWGWAGR